MSSFLRRTFSRRLPDRLLEISECIYVFDSCLTTSSMNEKEFKSYLGGVVSSLQRFHAGASFMVFNFREGDQISLLSDILIDYDMTVVDYPRNHEGYPLLPLEMIHYILRSSESWLSLQGQKNVILMHCEKGGWPVLAFMLAGLLLYRKQHSGEQKTLEMVHKMAPKQIFSVLSPINARASQLRYLRYITGRDLAVDWPPPDTPFVVDYLLLHNLPLFDGGKGCRPVVRVYGQDPSEKADRGPRLLLSTLMADEPAWQYPKEECMNVKLQLCCQVQGDVFLECIHLFDDLATEELIFKVMFHTGFIQSNILELKSGDIDVPWTANHQLPKDFMAELLFRDINETPPPHITMDLGSMEDYRDSENEFFEAEEIFTPMSVSPETKAGFKMNMHQEATVKSSTNRDFTLHNGSPRWDLESEKVTDLGVSKGIAFDEGIAKHSSEKIPHIKDILVTEISSFNERDIEETQLQLPLEKAESNNKGGLGAGTDIFASRDIASDLTNHGQVSEKDPASKNIVFIDDMYHSEVLKKELDVGPLEDIIIGDYQYVTEASDTQPMEGVDGGHYIPTSEAEFVANGFKNIVVDESNHIQALEREMYDSEPLQVEKSDISTSKDKDNVLVDDNNHKQGSAIESDISTSKNIIGVDNRNDKEVLEKHSDKGHDITSMLQNVVVDDTNHIESTKTKVDISEAEGAESDIRVLIDIVQLNDKSLEKVSERKLHISASNNTGMGDINNHEEVERQSDIIASKNIVAGDIKIHNEALETQSKTHYDEDHDIQASGEVYKSGLKNTVVDESNHINAPKTTAEITGASIKEELGIRDIVLVDDKSDKQIPKIKHDVTSSKNIIVLDIRNDTEALETQFEVQTDKFHDIQVSGATSVILDESQHLKFQKEDVEASTADLGITASPYIMLVGDKSDKKTSEIEVNIIAPKNIEAGDIRKETEIIVQDTKTMVEAVIGHDISASRDELVTSVPDECDHFPTPKPEMDDSVIASTENFGVKPPMKSILADGTSHKHDSEIEAGGMEASDNIVAKDNKDQKDATETQPNTNISTSKRNEVGVNMNNKQSTDKEGEVVNVLPKNFIVVDDKSQMQHVKVEVQPKLVVPSSSTLKPITNKRNKWQDIAAKTITQQRVVSQWVPRVKPQAPGLTKPKATAYKWIPKGAAPAPAPPTTDN